LKFQEIIIQELAEMENSARLPAQSVYPNLISGRKTWLAVIGTLCPPYGYME
jgi:hypothetical protein